MFTKHVSTLLLFLLAAVILSPGASPASPRDGMLTADSLSSLPPLPEAAGISADLPGDADRDWWTHFNDPLLDSLISAGLRRNFNVVEAVHRLGQAQAAIESARAGYYPSLTLNAGYTRNRSAGAIEGHDVRAMTTDYLGLGVNLSWQIDIFGKITSRVKQSKAAFRASRADMFATELTVSASIASAYISLRLLQAEQLVAREHCASQKKVLDIAKARYEAGLGDKLQVAQASSVYYSTLATLPGLESSIAAAMNSLTILCGELPGSMSAELAALRGMPDHTGVIAVGIPADLIRRRPDIAAAEATVSADAAALGIARKDYLPTLSIEGSFGTRAHRPGDLFANNSLTYTVAPTLSWTVFDGFGRRAAVASARERMEADVAAYNMTVATAVGDVNNAIIAYSTACAQIEAFAKVMNECEETVRLSVDLYKGGLSGMTDVVQAQLSFLTYTNSWLEARARALSSIVTLYQALGGGWDIEMLDR